MIKKIISEGQTGADRAGIDAAIESGTDYGGWVPKGRKQKMVSCLKNIPNFKK